MVTKPLVKMNSTKNCLILAKIYMVTKLAALYAILIVFTCSLILAKIYMVTKLNCFTSTSWSCLILAKIYMVTKLLYAKMDLKESLILAKIYMVTKPQIHNSIYLKTNKS